MDDAGTSKGKSDGESGSSGISFLQLQWLFKIIFFLNVGTYLVYKTIFSTCPHELEYIFPSSIKTPHPFTSFKRKDIPSHQPIPIVIPT